MAKHNTRYSLAHLLLLTASVAVFCVVLMNDNQWLTATYVTTALGIALNTLIAAIFARGERRAFSLGFVVGILFFGLSIYSATFTLPYLISTELLTLLKSTSTSPPSDEHFLLVTSVMWVMLTATGSGLLALSWHRSIHIAPQQPAASETAETKPSDAVAREL